jgi:hypothetical protein
MHSSLAGETEEKRLLRRTRGRLENHFKMCLKKQDVRVWTGFNRLRIRTSGGVL